MDDLKFSSLRNDVQEIIDLMAQKQFQTANEKLIDASEYLDELLDFSEDDADLVEISKYQVLLNQLQLQIKSALT